MANNIFNYTLIASTIRLSTPLILAALGGLYSERCGVINIALEGMMLAGAFTAAVVTVFTQNPWAGVLAAVAAGLLVALFHAVATVSYRADQVVSGAAINILFLGAPALLSGAFFESTGATPQLPRDQTLPDTPVFDAQTSHALASIFNQKPLVYLAFLLVGVTAYVIYRTRFGLRLRAVGENPEAALAAGVGVNRMRYAGVLISGALAALGGAYLSIGQNSLFTRNMTAGRGYIALAALIFGKWNPTGALLACLFFGFAEAVAIRMQGTVDIPNQFIQLIPYVLTMVVLAGWIGRATPPKALGIPYVKE
ncbi:MAG TPA: ABC transporter permease [Blastocatellia bacterium]|jgi:simple sugar transport system permease protein|nr:ABC transporter permease [Blastocatellia bacterium]